LLVEGPLIVTKCIFQRAVIKIWRRMAPNFSSMACVMRIQMSGSNFKPPALPTWLLQGRGVDNRPGMGAFGAFQLELATPPHSPGESWREAALDFAT
jgi:hypothetical protein